MARTMAVETNKTYRSQDTSAVTAQMVRSMLNTTGVDRETEITPETVRLLIDLTNAQARAETAGSLGRIADALTTIAAQRPGSR